MHRGAWALVKGLSLLLGKAQLRSVLWKMLLLLLVMALVLTVGVYELAIWLSELLKPGGDAWYVELYNWLLSFVAVLLALAVGVVGFVTLGSVAAAPWLDELYVRVAKMNGIGSKVKKQPSWKSIAESLWNSVMPLANFLPLAVVAGAFLLVPFYGTIGATIVWTWAGIKLLSFEFLDTPAAFKGWQWPERKKEVTENRWFYIGFSGLAMLLLIVPGLNLLVLPAAVVALFPQLNNEEFHEVSDHTFFPLD